MTDSDKLRGLPVVAWRLVVTDTGFVRGVMHYKPTKAMLDFSHLDGEQYEPLVLATDYAELLDEMAELRARLDWITTGRRNGNVT